MVQKQVSFTAGSGALALPEPLARTGLPQGVFPRESQDLGPEIVLHQSMMTYKQVQQSLREVGVVMSKPHGRYRLNFFGGLPTTEQFASDLREALEKGLHLASTRKGPAW